MAQHNELGREGEELALNYLAKKGYEILETNWKMGKKEIDIIARKKDLVVIVEVKTRSTEYFGRPEESVTLSKQKFLVSAADSYAQNLEYEVEIRYDIISIIKNSRTVDINHIEDAFIPLLE